MRKARDKVSKGRTKRSEVKTRLRSAAMQYAGLIFPSLPIRDTAPQGVLITTGEFQRTGEVNECCVDQTRRSTL